MIEHSKSVRKGISKGLMIVDMPYNTYNNKFKALNNCKKIFFDYEFPEVIDSKILNSKHCLKVTSYNGKTKA